MHGTGFQRPQPDPTHVFAIGDPASLPALNSLLDALDTAPATIWFEGVVDGLPCRADATRHDLRQVPRRDSGAHLITEVKTSLPELLGAGPEPYVWIACDTTTTRTLSSYVRKELGVPKQRMHALGYWRP